jgi:hypothetical protein
MSASTDLTVKAREIIFQEMDPVTQAAAQEGLKKVESGRKIAVLVSYDLGTIVNSVLEAKHLNETQQRQELKKLAAYWNQPELGPTTLYDLRNVAIGFDRDFVKAQVESPMANGQYLSWGHFRELQKMPTDTPAGVKAQMARLKQIRHHCMTVNELELEGQGRRDSEIKRMGGRKPSLPKTPTAMLQKIYTTVQLTDNYLQAMSEPLGGIFLEMPPQDVDAQFVANIDSTLARMAEAQQHILETSQQLQKVRTRAQSVLTKQSSLKTVAAKRAADDLEYADIVVKTAMVGKVSQPIATTARKLPKRATAGAAGKE